MEVLETTLNLGTPKITYKDPETDKTMVDEKATKEICAKQAALAGKEYTDKAEGGQALIDTAKKEAVTHNGSIIGKFKGFPIKANYDFMQKKATLTLAGKENHLVDVSKDGHAMIRVLDNALERISREIIPRLETKIDDLQHHLETARNEMDKPFPKEQELAEKSKRLEELNEELLADMSEDVKPSEQAKEEAEINAVRENSALVNEITADAPVEDERKKNMKDFSMVQQADGKFSLYGDVENEKTGVFEKMCLKVNCTKEELVTLGKKIGVEIRDEWNDDGMLMAMGNVPPTMIDKELISLSNMIVQGVSGESLEGYEATIYSNTLSDIAIPDDSPVDLPVQAEFGEFSVHFADNQIAESFAEAMMDEIPDMDVSISTREMSEENMDKLMENTKDIYAYGTSDHGYVSFAFDKDEQSVTATRYDAECTPYAQEKVVYMERNDFAEQAANFSGMMFISKELENPAFDNIDELHWINTEQFVADVENHEQH